MPRCLRLRITPKTHISRGYLKKAEPYLLLIQPHGYQILVNDYPRRARSALGVDTVLTLDVCLYVSALERKRLIGMT